MNNKLSSGFKEDPSKVLEGLYQRVYQKDMKGLPISNPVIKVEAIGFRVWEGQWVGVMITPWFINLLILWREGEDWPELKLNKGNDLIISFPAGPIKFTPRFEPELGYYLCCSLASPMGDFVSHTQAVNSAVEVMKQLTAIPLVDISSVQDPSSVQDLLSTQEKSLTQEKPLTQEKSLTQEHSSEKSLSRRDFLRGTHIMEPSADHSKTLGDEQDVPWQLTGAREIITTVEASLKKSG